MTYPEAAELNFIPTSTAWLLVDAGFNGCAVADQTEQGHITINETACEAPFSVAVTITVSSPLGVTLAAVTGNVAVDEEAGTVNEDGAVTAVPFSESSKVTPPFGAGAERVTAHVLLAPALRLVGLQASVEIVSGATRFKVKVWEVPFSAAVIAAVWLVVTVPAVAVKVAAAAPAATVTALGTPSAGLLLANATLAPPVGAA